MTILLIRRFRVRAPDAPAGLTCGNPFRCCPAFGRVVGRVAPQLRCSQRTECATGTETYDYDADGHLTKVTAPDGLVKLAAGYGSDGRVAWIEQAGAGRTTFSYDDADGKRIVTLADGTVITQRYDWAGRLVSERLGKTGTHVVYDGDGRVTASITGVPGAAMSGYGPPASLTLYDGHGDPYLKVDPMGNATSTTFNSKHEPLLTTRPDGSTISRSYDDQGRMTELDDPRGKPWLYTYNSFGELRTRTDPLSRDITIGYAGNGDVTSLTDQTHAITQYGYDPQGRRTSVTTPLGHETDTEYTPWDAVKKVTTPNGGITATGYDTDRRITQVTDPPHRHARPLLRPRHRHLHHIRHPPRLPHDPAIAQQVPLRRRRPRQHHRPRRAHCHTSHRNRTSRR